MPHPRAAAWSALVSLAVVVALPGAAAAALTDPEGDVDGDGLDIVAVVWSLGNATAVVEVRFAAGDRPMDGAIRGVMLLGTPGEAEPAEWYQFTVAETASAFAGHAGPREAVVVATSWTGDTARIEVQRDAPAAAPCAFAVVEAGRMTEQGFVRSDVGPSGFDSPEDAWPVDACPEMQMHGEAEEEPDEKGSPGLALPALLGALLFALASRRR